MDRQVPWPSIPAMVRDACARYADREAIVDDIRWSFADLDAAIRTCARATIAAGIEPGDRVAIWAPNMREWIVAALGALAAGAVVVPINTRFKGREAAYVLARSRARLLFTARGFLGTDYVEMLGDERPPTLERIVVLRDDDWDRFLAEAPGVTDDEAGARAGSITADQPSDIIFTSGTTGAPKGVIATHGQSLRVFETWSRLAGLREGDRYLIVNPFFHTFGYKAGFLSAIMRGATIIPHAVFDPATVMARVTEERVSVLPGPPTLYQSILNDPVRATRDLSSLRLAVTGAAVIPVELIERMRDELRFETVLTAYGLTESTGVATMCSPGDDARTIATTSGRAIPDTEVAVVSEDGKEVPRGEPGEVVVRGYNVTAGYFEDPAATAEAIDRDGWLHTGDVGVMDERGYVRITDRLKDMFIVGGFNAYPAEIEAELLRFPAIVQAAVVGVPDERLGEVGVAFVVPRHGQQVEPAEIVDWARARMANYKAPRRVVVVDSLPMNASGKVLKFELRERARRD
jgi:acyl-CoA synthetase (AMP-forming)/AMP-acid ligase II